MQSTNSAPLAKTKTQRKNSRYTNIQAFTGAGTQLRGARTFQGDAALRKRSPADDEVTSRTRLRLWHVAFNGSKAYRIWAASEASAALNDTNCSFPSFEFPPSSPFHLTKRAPLPTEALVSLTDTEADVLRMSDNGENGHGHRLQQENARGRCPAGKRPAYETKE